MIFSCKRCTITSLLLSFLLLFSSGSFADGPTGNKFRDREASDDSLGYPSVDEEALLNSQCPQHVELRWQAEVSSSIYATPLIADINNDGKLDIVVPSFVHYLEVLEGSDGDKMPGFPTFHQSYVHSSPLLFDIDKDGMREIALATYNGEVLFFRPSGYQMNEKLVVPRRKIRKDWFVGLVSDAADRSHPDVHDDSLVKDIPSAISVPASNASHSSSNGGDISSVIGSDTNGLKENITEQSHLDSSHSLDNHNLSVEQKENNTEPSHVEMPKTTENILGSASQNSNSDSAHNTTEGTSTAQRRLLESSETKGSEAHGADTTVGGNEGFGSKSFNVENEEKLEDIADASFDLFRDGGELPEYNYDYDDYPDEAMWGDEEWSEVKHAKLEDYVEVDAHILCTPVIADIDNDGVSEMVVAVSHFFDHEYYANQEHLSELGNLDISKYVAGSVVVFNLDTKQVKWTAQLDMSTDSGTYRAYLYSSPSVVDLDGDGNLDILVGTSFGYFYVFDHQGKIRQNFPLQMGEIQGATVAADINDDGRIELITTDSHGNVAAWTANGDEIWEVHLKSLIPQGPTIGDVDGDGHTDIVIPTISGNIYVLSGKDGSLVRPFPYRTHGRIMSPILLVDLSKRGEKKKGLTLVTTAFDGYLYLIDGSTACADVVDIGETSYSMVLAENVDGGDDLDLIVTTMNGNVFCFSTPAPHHPLKTWTSSFQGRNNVGTRYNREGIYVKSSSRAFRDEEGSNFWVEMEVVDKYKYSAGSQGPYNVTTSLLVPGNYQGLRKISQSQILEGPGKHRVKLPTVTVRTTGTVLVEMVDKNGIYFSDEFSLTFHMHYYKLLKWFMVLPMLAMFGILVILRPQEGTPLPSFSTSRHREL